MASLDVPEILIGVGLIAALAWAVYNRLHPQRDNTGKLARR
jgi:hypothetical protein